MSTNPELRMRIAETFVSRQGEGRLTGVESFFIRTSGCNLRCWFCDTPYASWRPEGDQVAVADLVGLASHSGCRHVVLTGGEPLVSPLCEELCQSLTAAGLHLTIETAGTIQREVACDLLSLSPKLRSSAPDATEHPTWHQQHQQRRMPLDVMRCLIDQASSVQVKFVVNSAADLAEIDEVVAGLGIASQDVWLMPQGVTNEQLDAAQTWLRPYCQSAGFSYGERMQIRWYGNRRGT